MSIENIGQNAGKVWQSLHENGAMNVSALGKSTGLDDKNLYLALGWLAREGNVTFAQVLRQIIVSLVQK
jgi:hypothetical protein